DGAFARVPGSRDRGHRLPALTDCRLRRPPRDSSCGQGTMRLRDTIDLARQTFKAWSEDKAPRIGAALSYYTIFSMAPLLVLVIAAVGLIYGPDAVRGRIVEQMSGLVGAEGARLEIGRAHV